MDNKFSSNAWLITNTQLYFSDHLLKYDGRDYNAYGLLDLSNLLNAIVLSDNLVTLPGENNKIKINLKRI